METKCEPKLGAKGCVLIPPAILNLEFLGRSEGHMRSGVYADCHQSLLYTKEEKGREGGRPMHRCVASVCVAGKEGGVLPKCKVVSLPQVLGLLFQEDHGPESFVLRLRNKLELSSSETHDTFKKLSAEIVERLCESQGFQTESENKNQIR